MNIGLLDSGIGGFNCLKSIIENYGSNNFYYYIDCLNMPYGTKSNAEIKNFVFNGFKELIKYQPDFIIIACNTASTVALKDLKKVFKKITGIAPPVSEVIGQGYKRTLLIGTPATVRSLDSILEKNKDKIIPCPLGDLATLVENNSDNINSLKPYMQSILDKYPDIDSMILGCTHYIYVKKIIQQIRPDIVLFDGNDSLIKETKKYLKDSIMKKSEKSNIFIIDSQKDLEKRNNDFQKILKILRNLDIKAEIKLI